MVEKISDDKGNDHVDKDLELIIKTPNGDWTKEFHHNAKVADVIIAVVQHYNYASNGKYEIRLESNPETVLKPERTLVSYKIGDGTVLVFIDFGAAV
jgi:hypothetical protein